jgi:hypothetical protein
MNESDRTRTRGRHFYSIGFLITGYILSMLGVSCTMFAWLSTVYTGDGALSVIATDPLFQRWLSAEGWLPLSLAMRAGTA